jgi:hypothetical protein
MDAIGLPAHAAPARELEDFLRETASALSAAEATALALRAWIAAQRQQRAGTPQAADRPPARAGANGTCVRGYQWKCVFLPDGTELRMEFARQDFHARVSGNAIVYAGMPVSPRQFTLAVAGDGRNAWRDLWVRFPGERSWIRAMLLRRRCAQQAEKQPLSPLEAMREAAACMCETLKNALALVERSNELAVPRFERRLARPRRAIDVPGDACMLD